MSANFFCSKKRIRIGLLGGSFNPSHTGHIHISKIALKKLNLTEIWWLVSPQNRLKKTNIKDTYYKRLKHAKRLLSNEIKIKVLDLEFKNNLRNSFETLKFIEKRKMFSKFVWIMGSDNLENFHLWIKAKQISKIFPVAVVERPGYSLIMKNFVNVKFLGKKYKSSNKIFFNNNSNKWIYIKSNLNFNSSTLIRSKNYLYE